MKIVLAIPKLSQYQIDELFRILQEEKQKFENLDEEHWQRLEELEIKHRREWEELEIEIYIEEKGKEFDEFLDSIWSGLANSADGKSCGLSGAEDCVQKS